MNNLLIRTVVGFLALLLILALCLFLSAESFGYWQAWLFLAVFFGCSGLITIYLIRYDQRLLAGRVDAGPTAETQKSQQIIQSLASLCFIALLIVPGLDYRFHWLTVPFPLVLISEGLIALGFFIVFLVFRVNSFTSATIEVAQEQKVISTGPYSVVRHPMYAGALLLILFMPLALGSWVALPFAIMMVLVIAGRLLAEEKFLEESLAGYKEYRQKVRYRLLPFVW